MDEYNVKITLLKSTIYVPSQSAPTLKPFDPDEFIRSLSKVGPQLTSDIKGNWENLYR